MSAIRSRSGRTAAALGPDGTVADRRVSSTTRSSTSWTRLPLSSGVISRNRSGSSVTSTRKTDSKRYRWGQLAHVSRRVADVTPPAGAGPGWARGGAGARGRGGGRGCRPGGGGSGRGAAVPPGGGERGGAGGPWAGGEPPARSPARGPAGGGNCRVRGGGAPAGKQ